MEFILQSAHWALALVPVLVLVAIFTWLDAFKLMSGRELLALLLLGGVAALAAYPISGRMLDTLPIGFSNYSRFIAPWIEEALKALAVILLFRLNRIGYKIDAVISGFAIGAGFSVVENIIYLSFFPQYAAGTWLVRGFGTAVMHGTTLALLAAIAHELSERETRGAAANYHFNLLWFVPGYLLAVALHMAFNQFPDRPLVAMLGAMVVGPLAIIAIFQFGTSEAESWLTVERAEHQAQLEALRSGKWPATKAGQAIGALAGRLGPRTAERLRRYWEVQAWLVLQAEQTMLAEELGDVDLDGAAIHAAFAELAELKAALGRTAFHTLKRLLPFSRNDYWEVSELRQRVAHQEHHHRHHAAAKS